MGIETQTQAQVLSLDQQITALRTLLGNARELLPGQLKTNEKGQLDIAAGTLSEKEIQKRVTDIIGDGKVDTYQELSEYQYLNKVLRAVRVWNALQKAKTQADKQKLMREYIVANQAATYHEYLPEVIEQTEQVLREYQELKDLSKRLGTPIAKEILDMEAKSDVFVRALETNISRQLRFANASTVRQQIALQERIPAIDKETARLQALKNPTADESAALERMLDMQRWIDRLQLRTLKPADLQKLLKEREALLSADDRAVLQKNNDAERLVRSNLIREEMISILTGKAKALGTKEDFAPQKMFVELWKQLDKQTVQLQIQLEKKLAADPKKAEEFKADKEYLKNIREGMNGHLSAFVHDLGRYQLTLDELTRVQNLIGKHLDFEAIVPMNQDLASTDADALAAWLEERSAYRSASIRTALDQTEDMLKIDTGKRIEDWSTKEGEKMVLNTAVKLARFASIMMPSKDNTGMLGETYRAAAALIGLPESKEQNIKNLSGPIADALGIPPNKTWDELSVIEKKEVERRSKSVIDAIEKFDRGAIERLRQSMALTDEMQKAHPVQEFAGEEVDGEIIKQLEGTRIDHDMTGEKMGGKTINRATAFILALRQRRDDWGDPEKRTGYMGQYRMFIDRLESNIQHHIDLGGAMFQMQRAWNEYAFGMLKLAGGTALALWIIALLGGSAAVIGIQTMKVVGRAGMNTLRSLRGGARTIGQTVRNLPETPGVINRTKDMLTKMRYLESERRLAKALESTKLGKTLARLKTLQNTRIAKIGGAGLKYASWGAVPAITFYQLYAQNQRRAGVTQEELKAEYANQMGITALEGTGLGATLFLGTGAGIVLAAPVIYAGDFALKRSEVRADWKRDVASYMKEYDSAGLRAKIEQTTSSAAVEAGGGGALRPRIMMPSKADIEAASVAIEQGVAGARQSAYEAYFWQNLLVSPGTNEQMQKKIVNDKMTYLRSATSDDYDDAYNTVLDRADIYADLIQRREMLIRSGEPPLLSYEDETGERKFIDLRLLSPSVAKDGPEMRAVVGDYLNHLQPVEEAALFELMGTVALDEKTEAAWEREKAAVRKVLLRKLVHRIHDAEKQIRLIDWPGINVPFVTSGDSYSQDVVRAYLAGKVSEQVDALTTEMMRGEVKPADYPKRMTDIYATLEGILAVTDSPTYLKTAQDYVTAQGIPVNTAENALIKLLTE